MCAHPPPLRLRNFPFSFIVKCLIKNIYVTFNQELPCYWHWCARNLFGPRSCTKNLSSRTELSPGRIAEESGLPNFTRRTSSLSMRSSRTSSGLINRCANGDPLSTMRLKWSIPSGTGYCCGGVSQSINLSPSLTVVFWNSCELQMTVWK